MNELRISGVLRGVNKYDRNGKRFAAATLQFRPDESILVLAASPGTLRELEGFDCGDAIVVSGRIASHRNSLCILLDRIEHYALARTPTKFAFHPTSANRTMRELEKTS